MAGTVATLVFIVWGSSSVPELLGGGVFPLRVLSPPVLALIACTAARSNILGLHHCQPTWRLSTAYGTWFLCVSIGLAIASVIAAPGGGRLEFAIFAGTLCSVTFALIAVFGNSALILPIMVVIGDEMFARDLVTQSGELVYSAERALQTAMLPLWIIAGGVYAICSSVFQRRL